MRKAVGAGFTASIQEVGGFRDLELAAFESGDINLAPEYAASMLEALNGNAGEATPDAVETTALLNAALAFLFAVFLARPCPFYILDEVEAALDDLNIDRFLKVLGQFSDRAQFIVVTHQKRTMEAADCLYGVSMAGNGVSKVISRRLPPPRAADAA